MQAIEKNDHRLNDYLKMSGMVKVHSVSEPSFCDQINTSVLHLVFPLLNIEI